MRVSYRPKTPICRTVSEEPDRSSNNLPKLRRTYSLRKPSNENKPLYHRSSSSSSTLRRSKSFGRSGVSYLNFTPKESPDTQFIRNTTGRGSIRKGPAPTRASILRRQSSQTTTCLEEQPVYQHSKPLPMPPVTPKEGQTPAMSAHQRYFNQ